MIGEWAILSGLDDMMKSTRPPLMIQTLFGSAPPKAGLFERLQQAVEKTRAGLVDRIEDIVQGRKEIDADLLDELEMTLISADVGVRTATEVLDAVRDKVSRRQLNDAAELKMHIWQHLLEILTSAERPAQAVDGEPEVI